MGMLKKTIGGTIMACAAMMLGNASASTPVPSGQRQLGQSIVEPAYNYLNGGFIYVHTPSGAHVPANG